jgi:hypothetical protein
VECWAGIILVLIVVSIVVVTRVTLVMVCTISITDFGDLGKNQTINVSKFSIIIDVKEQEAVTLSHI